MSDVASILLHLDATPSSMVRLEVASELAARLDAGITALFGAAWDADRASFAYSASAALEASAFDPAALAHEEAKAHLRRHRLFDSPEVTWCEIVGHSVARGFVEEAVYADLLVVGQESRLPESGSAPPGFVETAILDSGKPTIVVPALLRTPTVARCIVVAWNGSAQAARALAGALPLLRLADAVHVASWSRLAPAAPFSRVDAIGWLRRHGVDAELHLLEPSAHVAREIGPFAARVGGDLIVMGCYGRSRASERVFGGATRSVLAAMDVAVLMAH
jgi:nucleotide-binding universal stress UspA family protein